MPMCIVSDEQRRILPEFTRPKGSQKMADFFASPRRLIDFTDKPPRRDLKSSHFLASQFDCSLYPAPLSKTTAKYLFYGLTRDYLKIQIAVE